MVYLQMLSTHNNQPSPHGRIPQSLAFRQTHHFTALPNHLKLPTFEPATKQALTLTRQQSGNRQERMKKKQQLLASPSQPSLRSSSVHSPLIVRSAFALGPLCLRSTFVPPSFKVCHTSDAAPTRLRFQSGDRAKV